MQLERGWRVVAYGICFTCFGVGGLLLRFIIFPLLFFVCRQEQQRVYYARYVIHCLFRFFIALVSYSRAIEFRVVNAEKLKRTGLLVLANHPTLLDVVLLISIMKNTSCIVKGTLFSHFATSGPVRAAGYISNVSHDWLQDCGKALQNGSNVVIFPEGTRSGINKALSFNRGAANVAIRLQKNVTPVVIKCEPPTLMKGEKWYHVPIKKAVITLTVEEDITIEPFIRQTHSQALAARQFNHYLEKYFSLEARDANT
jgi:1-acyl-sn-glycerol-3-phosphate acyltransferase